MNRAQFMKQLEKLLSDISEEERKEALDYYESYFDDAGPEREAEVLRELGSPGKVAAIIKADLGEKTKENTQKEATGTAGQKIKSIFRKEKKDITQITEEAKPV